MDENVQLIIEEIHYIDKLEFPTEPHEIYLGVRSIKNPHNLLITDLMQGLCFYYFLEDGTRVHFEISKEEILPLSTSLAYIEKNDMAWPPDTRSATFAAKSGVLISAEISNSCNKSYYIQFPSGLRLSIKSDNKEKLLSFIKKADSFIKGITS